MFLLANVVDDADMGITHVIRGEDMVNNTPKQLLLRAARSGVRPSGDRTFAHLPLLVDEPAQAVQALRGRVGGDYRDAGSWPRRWPTTWRCSAGGRPTAWRSGRWPRSSSASGWRTSTRPARSST